MVTTVRMGQLEITLFMSRDFFLLGMYKVFYTANALDGIFPDREVLKTKYFNDLDPWIYHKNFQTVCSEDQYDDGLYSGETVMHIAIVQGETAVVQYLLD